MAIKGNLRLMVLNTIQYQSLYSIVCLNGECQQKSKSKAYNLMT